MKNALQIGFAYLIRTVTLYWVGRVVGVSEGAVILNSASWIPDTGDYSSCLESGMFDAVQPVPGDGIAIVSIGAIVDAVVWEHPLPRERK